MSQISSSWETNSGDDTTLAVSITDTQTTGIILSPINRNGTDEAWKTLTGCVVEITQEIEGEKRVEYMGIGGGVVNSDYSVTLTAGDITRNIPRDTTTLSGTGTGQKFNVGARVRLVVFHYLLNKKANIDRANTFTGTQTFSGTVVFTGISKVPVYADAAARDVAIPSPANGMEVYLTTEGYFTDYAGGWVQRASGATANMSTTVAGKAEEGTVAEQAAHTATGGTGARIVPAIANLVTLAADGTWISGAIPTLNTAKYLDGSIGGIGLATPVLGALLIGGGAGLAMTAIGPGTNGQVPRSNGTTLAMGTVPAFGKEVLVSGADSATRGAGIDTDFAFDVHTYTIPANDLIAGVCYKFSFGLRLTWIAGNTDYFIYLGATKVGVTNEFTPNQDCSVTVEGAVFGTAAAGASVNVRCAYTVVSNGGVNVDLGARVDEVAVATNGTLVLALGAAFKTANAGNALVLKTGNITRCSTTAA